MSRIRPGLSKVRDYVLWNGTSDSAGHHLEEPVRRRFQLYLERESSMARIPSFSASAFPALTSRAFATTCSRNAVGDASEGSSARRHEKTKSRAVITLPSLHRAAVVAGAAEHLRVY